MIEQLKRSLEAWDKGQMILKHQTLKDNERRLTKMIRDGKKGMAEADRVHKLMQELELTRIAKFEQTKADYMQGVDLCAYAIANYRKRKKKKPVKPKPVIEVELPIKEIVKIIEKPKPKKPEWKPPKLPEPIEEEEEEFPCPHCPKVYTSAPTLKRHITMKHKEE